MSVKRFRNLDIKVRHDSLVVFAFRTSIQHPISIYIDRAHPFDIPKTVSYPTKHINIKHIHPSPPVSFQTRIAHEPSIHTSTSKLQHHPNHTRHPITKTPTMCHRRCNAAYQQPISCCGTTRRQQRREQRLARRSEGPIHQLVYAVAQPQPQPQSRQLQLQPNSLFAVQDQPYGSCYAPCRRRRKGGMASLLIAGIGLGVEKLREKKEKKKVAAAAAAAAGGDASSSLATQERGVSERGVPRKSEEVRWDGERRGSFDSTRSDADQDGVPPPRYEDVVRAGQGALGSRRV
ncbi:hypothetical protein BU24DRAFT_423406 [Aaosphaeria arxii CBS 175.79]|uniref:Uncharacterized protein n=1 Tax=Aaosphaeria arxii CBS 175.79 TaxID=1450172 RepID=A0A6A5XNG6_9PLEO|nr:uncharacterized protein BU24DRAFT_423406 [Aaosphaeria arxii CBS 175.79]KAF2014473.1 hypothetical protein BU24DRAFT_423406 [Aaosphaeria arxii CBS 175.79]